MAVLLNQVDARGKRLLTRTAVRDGRVISWGALGKHTTSKERVTGSEFSECKLTVKDLTQNFKNSSVLE